MDNKKIIGNRINSALASTKKKQLDLANHLQVKPNVISYFLSGTRTPNTEQIIEIAKFLNVSTDFLLGVSDCSSKNLNIKSIHETTGLSEKAIEVLITEKFAYREQNFLRTVNYLLEDMKPLQEFKENTFEYYECNQDVLTLIDEFINTSADLLYQTLTVSSDGISITNSESFESRYNTSISAEEIFKQVMLDRITEELKKQRVYNLLKKGKRISYEDNCKYNSFIKNAL